MKKFLKIIVTLLIVISLTGCKPEEEYISEEEIYTNFISEWTSFQKVTTLNARVETDSEGNKMLMADIKNSNYEGKISDIVLSFATWDENGNFIIIKTKKQPENDKSEFQMNIDDIEISAGEIWKADKGLYLDENCNEIKYAKAAVVSYKENGKEIINDMYTGWKDTYLNRTLTSWMQNIDNAYDPVYKYNLLKTNLESESAYVTKTTVYKNTETGDIFLTANIKNNSNKNISDISVAFVAHDIEGNPIMIKSASGLTDDSYVKEVNLGDITISSKEEWLGDTETDVIGLRVKSEQININYVKAIVISYTDSDGKKWNNPFYTNWQNIFEGKKLEEWMR